MPVRAQVSTRLRFAEVTAEIEERITLGKNRAAEAALVDSLEEVPVDLGTLRSSGTVELADGIDDPAMVVYDTPYAARLHEHPEYEFSQEANPGAKGKYLEDPVIANRAKYAAIIAATARGSA